MTTWKDPCCPFFILLFSQKHLLRPHNVLDAVPGVEDRYSSEKNVFSVLTKADVTQLMLYNFCLMHDLWMDNLELIVELVIA